MKITIKLLIINIKTIFFFISDRVPTKKDLLTWLHLLFFSECFKAYYCVCFKIVVLSYLCLKSSYPLQSQIASGFDDKNCALQKGSCPHFWGYKNSSKIQANLKYIFFNLKKHCVRKLRNNRFRNIHDGCNLYYFEFETVVFQCKALRRPFWPVGNWCKIWWWHSKWFQFHLWNCSPKID